MIEMHLNSRYSIKWKKQLEMCSSGNLDINSSFKQDVGEECFTRVLFNPKWAFVSTISWRERVAFNERMMSTSY